MKKLNSILLIDDDDDDNFFHGIVAREAGLNNIHVAENAFVALEHLKQASPFPDLIFLDINMPKMNGWEFMQEYVRLNFHLKNNPVIVMLSTSLNPEDHKRSKATTGITDFKVKPLSEKILNDILQKYFS